VLRVPGADTAALAVWITNIFDRNSLALINLHQRRPSSLLDSNGPWLQQRRPAEAPLSALCEAVRAAAVH
jgi:hypothetical protein